MPVSNAVDHRLDFSNKNAARRVDRMLDDAVEDSFPASDPVSLSMPHDRVESRLQAMREQLELPSRNTMLLMAGGLLALIAFLTLKNRL